MKTLFILRHAKSSWDDPNLADFDRPLNARGKAAAPFMGKLMTDRGLVADVILSSPAVRAKKTAKLVKNAGQLDAHIEYDERIYEASPQTLTQVAAAIDDKFESAVIVGHNPGMEGFVRFLTGIAERMPTASLAVIDLDIDRWEQIDTRTGTLRCLIRPRDEMKATAHGA